MNAIRPAFGLVLIFTLLTGLALPLGFVGVGQAVFPFQARGSLIERDGHVVGSALIGQNFATERYFHPRPSAITNADPNDSSKTVPAPYDADNSLASNLAPSSKALLDRVAGDVKALGGAAIPADAVTTSASGLDPHISPENAERQVARVAAARKLDADRLRGLIAAHTEGRLGGIVGEPRVDVLGLNMALDRLALDAGSH